MFHVRYLLFMDRRGVYLSTGGFYSSLLFIKTFSPSPPAELSKKDRSKDVLHFASDQSLSYHDGRCGVPPLGGSRPPGGEKIPGGIWGIEKPSSGHDEGFLGG